MKFSYTSQSITTYRRHSDNVMRMRMLWAAIISFWVNLVAFLAVFHIDVVSGFFYQEVEGMTDLEDKVMIMLFVTLFTILFLLIIYGWKVKGLLNDIQRLAAEREKDREAYVRHQKLESLGLLAAGISHEINSCLQAILGSCEMAQARLDDRETTGMFLQRAIDNSLHARKVIANILTFSNGGGTQKFELLKLQDAVTEAISYSQTFLSGSIKVQLQQETAPLVANLDRIGFAQCLSNLMVNAAQAMDHTGTIVISSGQETLVAEDPSLITPIPPGPYLFVKVKDTGGGISMEHLQRIFDPFFSTKPIGEGTGLGLSIVHGLVKSMGGHINVRSLKGIGTEFIIYLPIPATETQPEEQA